MTEQDEHGLPLWPAAERNKQPILEQLLSLVPAGHGAFLEIASGTGQHALHFAPHFPGYDYYVSDCDPEHLTTLRRRIALCSTKNLMGPLALDTTAARWPLQRARVVFCANMIHIAPWAATLGLFRGASALLEPDGLLLTYGPYRQKGRHISESNEQFDLSLRQRNPEWGVRDTDELAEVARETGLDLTEIRSLPANNSLLVFRIIPSGN